MGDLRLARPSKRGQALPLFLVGFIVVAGFAGLALDGARLYNEHLRLQGAADAAAIGAAHELRRGHDNYGRDLLPAAIHDAGLQGVTADQAEIIVHYPPASGAFAKSQEHVEVVVRSELPTTFMGMFGVGPRVVSSRAVAGLIEGETPCLLALAEAQPDAFRVEGEQPFDSPCAANHAGAPDPFANLQMPSCAGRQPGSIDDSADGGPALYWPGCYDEAVTIRSGAAELMPGVHVFRHGLTISGGEVTGKDVTLIFPAGADQAGVSIGSAARVTLSAPARGELPGILMFGEGEEADLERGEGSDFRGALYFPNATLRLGPNAPSSASWLQAVAKQIVVLEAPGGRAVVPPPEDVAAGAMAALVE